MFETFFLCDSFRNFSAALHVNKTKIMKITIYIAISANGFISNSRNAPDWLSPEYSQGLVKICHKTKAVIMGKTTYNIIAPDYLPLKSEGITVVLTSDTHANPANSTVVFTSDKANEIVAMLEEKGFKEAVIIGGALTISEFMNAGLVDDVILVVEPVFFGKGLPLFKNVEFESKMTLREIGKLNANTVQFHYQMRLR